MSRIFTIEVTRAQRIWIEMGLHGEYNATHKTRVYLTLEQIKIASESLWMDGDDFIIDEMDHHGYMDWFDGDMRKYEWVKAQKRKSLNITIDKLSRKLDEIQR